MTINEQIRKLLTGYVYDRDTLAEITVPAKATRYQMEALAARHGLSISVVGREARLADSCYTYAVRGGEVDTISG